ncbi:MAG: hypothetical protein JWP14_386 [Frankiales bacterium]|nr:hypothetical protein [Frankiales bacterium]
MPTPFGEDDLRGRGFEGFIPFASAPLSAVPDEPGVYAVLGAGTPTFLERSPAGAWKGDPTVPLEVLRGRWLPESPTLYIGKAEASLRKRTSAYRRHGAGSSARHWGGRYIWQLADLELLLAWRTHTDAKGLETEMLREFSGLYGALPFANLRH